MGRKIAVVGISGNGKTTLARRLARRLDVPYVELDALNHLPGWTEASPEALRIAVKDAMRSDGWVLDGSYHSKIGDIVFERADAVVWLDQPLPLVLWRLVRRAIRDIRTKRELFNGNRQSWRMAFFVRDSLVSFAVKSYFRRRREWPAYFARFRALEVVRLRSPKAVERWFQAQ
jgi:adenylate kinase family enzyme